MGPDSKIEGGYTLFRRISCGLANGSGLTVDTLTNEDIACLDFIMDHNLAMLADYLSAIDFTLNPIADPEDGNEPDPQLEDPRRIQPPSEGGLTLNA